MTFIAPEKTITDLHTLHVNKQYKGSRQSWAAYYNKGTFHWAATASSSGTKKEVEGDDVASHFCFFW